MTQHTELFSPVRLGELALRNRIVMSPMTRIRADARHVPTPLMVEYYAQRASAGLIITECVMVSPLASAFITEPGIYDDEQVQAWRRVTDAVHERGGLIAMQIWHPGRAAHPFTNGGVTSISSTDRPIRDSLIQTPRGKVPQAAPRRLALEEIPGVVAQFRTAAENARKAGFDGVEIHGAHGYLLDQFLRDGINDRTDAYGGPIENRARLLFEVVDAAMEALGAGRVGLRISPLVAFNDASDSDPAGLTAYVAEQFERRRGAFFELRHNQHDEPAERELAAIARKALKTVPLLRNGGYDAAAGAEDIRSGRADAIVYGRPYIANPDLVERFRSGSALNAVDESTVYGGGPKGYTDYPTMAEAA